MTQAIRIAQPGGPEVLIEENADPGKPQAGEVLLRQTAIGVNFIDIYHRTGLYKLPAYPAGIGLEATGVVEKAGQGATFKPGDRVAYTGGTPGAYASHRVIADTHLVALPSHIPDDVGAAIMLKGLTAQYLLRQTFRVQEGDTVLIHAAAGGVGTIACQWAKHLGATVIGTAGTPEKADLARKHGCDHVILYRGENLVARVRDITQGRGVDVVYDSVGKSTFMDSLDCLKKLGMMVSFGNASGPVPPIEPLLLTQKGSLYLTRPSLWHYADDTKAYRAMAAELFALVGKGVIKVQIGGKYRLCDAAQAQTDLESRKTTGSLLLIP